MVGYIILILFLIFVIVLLARTFAFKPKARIETKEDKIDFDGDAAIKALAELVKCKTISYFDHSKEDDKEFEKLISLLPKLYPTVTKNCTMQRFDGRGLLFHWKGKNEGDPAIFMAHYDVVPVVEENWNYEPFEALIKDGVMWGRGTLDTKNTFNGVMSAAENLMKQGFVPQNDIFFAFSGGEEVVGVGAENIMHYFKENNITPSLVLDEGGAVVNNVFPGVAQPCGLIGIAEKGRMNVEFKINSNGGHASAPAPHTPVGRLAMACTKLEAHPFKRHFTKPVLEMFDTLGRHSSFLYRMIFANLWCFGGILDMICKKSGGELNALVRTTVAFTMMDGSKAPNVIPSTASMTANLRLNPEDTIETALSYIKSTIKDEDISLSVNNEANPSRISQTDCPAWNKVSCAVEQTWKGCIASPYLMVQCSDSYYYGEISDKVYRFSAADMTDDERHSIHGDNEHIRLDTIKRAVEFFMRVMKQC